VLVFALRGGFEHAAAAALFTCVITPIIALIFTGAVEVAGLPPLLLTTAIAALLVGAATTERQQTAERLEALVAQRTEELEKAYELQRHLVRSLGHDLRQPVEAINLTVAAIGDQSGMDMRNTALSRVRELGAVTSDLLTRILAYARLDTGDVQAERAPVQLAQLLDRLRATYTPQAQRRSLRLIWPDTGLTVTSDRDLLFQILSNHLDNAIRLTPEGGTVEIRIEPEESGIGILVIDGFQPASPHRSSRGGLGLRIVSQAANLLGAEMVDEQNRKGIILPTKG
jgi:signal transduction histidine kinase